MMMMMVRDHVTLRCTYRAPCPGLAQVKRRSADKNREKGYRPRLKVSTPTIRHYIATMRWTLIFFCVSQQIRHRDGKRTLTLEVKTGGVCAPSVTRGCAFERRFFKTFFAVALTFGSLYSHRRITSPINLLRRRRPWSGPGYR